MGRRGSGSRDRVKNLGGLGKSMGDADDILNARRTELETVDQAKMAEVVGVAQAIGDWRFAQCA